MFYFWIFSVPYKGFSVPYKGFLCIVDLIIACETAVISDRWIILEIAKDLKTKAFPSVVKLLVRHSLRTLSILRYGFENSFYVLVYCRRNVHQLFSQFFSLD